MGEKPIKETEQLYVDTPKNATSKNNLNIFLKTLDIYGIHGVYLHNNSARRPGSHRAWGIWKP